MVEQNGGSCVVASKMFVSNFLMGVKDIRDNITTTFDCLSGRIKCLKSHFAQLEENTKLVNSVKKSLHRQYSNYFKNAYQELLRMENTELELLGMENTKYDKIIEDFMLCPFIEQTQGSTH